MVIESLLPPTTAVVAEVGAGVVAGASADRAAGYATSGRVGAIAHLLPVVSAVLARPALWLEAVRVLRRFARRGWWRSWPPIPTPPSDYLAFRIQTHNGGPSCGAPSDGKRLVAAPPTASDVVAFLKWTGSNRQVLG